MTIFVTSRLSSQPTGQLFRNLSAVKVKVFLFRHSLWSDLLTVTGLQAQLIKARICAFFLKQFLVGANFNDIAAIHNRNAV